MKWVQVQEQVQTITSRTLCFQTLTTWIRQVAHLRASELAVKSQAQLSKRHACDLKVHLTSSLINNQAQNQKRSTVITSEVDHSTNPVSLVWELMVHLGPHSWVMAEETYFPAVVKWTPTQACRLELTPQQVNTGATRHLSQSGRRTTWGCLKQTI